MISSDGVKRREWLEAALVLSGGCRPRGIEPGDALRFGRICFGKPEYGEVERYALS